MLGMELCECSLHQLVTDRKLRPTPQQQHRVVRELCQALSFLHSHQIGIANLNTQITTGYHNAVGGFNNTR